MKILVFGICTQHAYHNFSPTATALGSSAIVKVSGQNCFRTLCGSLGQIRLGLLKGSAEGSTKGSTKVPPGFHHARFQVVSPVFWGRCVLSPMLLGIFFGLIVVVYVSLF